MISWSFNLFQQIKTVIRSWQKFYENSIHPNLLIIFSPEFQSLLLWKWWCYVLNTFLPLKPDRLKFSCDEGVFIQTLEEWTILLRNWFIVPIMTTRNLNQLNSLSAIFRLNNIWRCHGMAGFRKSLARFLHYRFQLVRFLINSVCFIRTTPQRENKYVLL